MARPTDSAATVRPSCVACCALSVGCGERAMRLWCGLSSLHSFVCAGWKARTTTSSRHLHLRHIHPPPLLRRLNGGVHHRLHADAVPQAGPARAVLADAHDELVILVVAEG